MRIIRAVKILCDILMMDLCHYTFIPTHRVRVNLKINYGFNSVKIQYDLLR